MIKLKKISSANVGPFFNHDFIHFEPDLTVITGQNDAGKSLLLKHIERLVKRDLQNFLESDVSAPHRMPPTAPWDRDDRIRSTVCIETEPDQGSEEIQIDYVLSPGVASIRYTGKFIHGATRLSANQNHHQLRGWPKIISINDLNDVLIREKILLSDASIDESALLKIAFPKDIHATEFSSLPLIQRRKITSSAEKRLNDRLSTFLPKSLNYKFLIEPHNDSSGYIHLGLSNSEEGYSSLSQHGSGVKKMISLLSRLAVENIGEEPAILILDEPETSLHADSQHTLRNVLEELSKLDNLQVIYATHSPAMINPMRPESVRVLKRIESEGHLFTRFLNRPTRDNFSVVRTSLGISPSDSLLYSPITVLVEGPTEALCLPKLIRRLCESEVEGFEGSMELLANCLFVSVNGNHFLPQCVMAKSFGIIPVIFADGDQQRRIPSQLRTDHLDVTIITPEDLTHEVEHLIDEASYFSALAKYLGKSADDINQNKFTAWESIQNLPSQMLFSKRVGRWVEELFNPNFSGKPEIMFIACCDAPIESIRSGTLKQLVKAMRSSMRKSLGVSVN